MRLSLFHLLSPFHLLCDFFSFHTHAQTICFVFPSKSKQACPRHLEGPVEARHRPHIQRRRCCFSLIALWGTLLPMCRLLCRPVAASTLSPQSSATHTTFTTYSVLALAKPLPYHCLAAAVCCCKLPPLTSLIRFGLCSLVTFLLVSATIYFVAAAAVAAAAVPGFPCSCTVQEAEPGVCGSCWK